MADLDTALKRLSGINVSCPWRAHYPLPDGTIDANDRPASMFLYALPASAPATTVALSGTAVGATEEDIRAGGRTIILTVTNDTWVSGAAFDAQRATMILNLYGDQVGATAWNAIVRATEPDTAVVRTSDTVITITLSAHPTYDISVTENITPTIDNALLTNGTIPLQTDPTTFQVTPVTPAAADTADTHDGFGYVQQDPHKKPKQDRNEVRRALLSAFAEADEVLAVAEPQAEAARTEARIEPVSEISMQDVSRAIRSLEALRNISEQLTRVERRQVEVKRKQLRAVEEEFALLMVLAQL